MSDREFARLDVLLNLEAGRIRVADAGTLLGDATSRLMHLRFVPTESTFDYFGATRAYLQRHGKLVAFYSDKRGVFRVNRKDAAGGDGMTQFGRALDQLNIDIICDRAPNEGSCRARERHLAGPAGEGDAACRNLDDRGRQRVPAGLE